MIVDTSALMAILLAEADAATFAERLERSTQSRISAGSMIEAGIVTLKRVGGKDAAALYRLIDRANIAVEPVDALQSEIAVRAYRRYGRGIGNPPCLNFGDCFAYALA